jgi:uncharacterized protein
MPQTTLPEWLAEAMQGLKSGDGAAWMKIYAHDAVHEFPFAGEGKVRRLEGRQAIADYMGNLAGRIRFGELRDIAVREVGDEVIIEMVGHHFTMPEGLPRTIGYIFIVTLRDGKVIRFRDYMADIPED